MNTTQTITGMLFMRTLTFWFIIALCSFLFITFIHYKNCERTKKPLNLIFLAILFVIIFSLTGGTWYYCIGRHPKLATQAKNSVVKTTQTVKDWNNKRKKDKDSEPTKKDDTPEDSPSDGKGKNRLNKAKEKIANKTDKIRTQREQRRQETENPTTNENAQLTVSDAIQKAIDDTNRIQEQYQGQHSKLIGELQRIQTTLDTETTNLEKTQVELDNITSVKEQNEYLINKTKYELETARRDVLDIELQRKVLQGQITLAEAEKESLERKTAKDLEDLENTENIKQREAIQNKINASNIKIAEYEKQIIDYNNQLIEKTSALATKNANVERLNTYMTNLNEIQKKYKESITKIIGDKSIEQAILNATKAEKARIEKEIELNNAKQVELAEKVKFYNFLRMSIGTAILANNDSNVTNDLTGLASQGIKAVGNISENTTAMFNPLKWVDSLKQMNLRHERLQNEINEEQKQRTQNEIERTQRIDNRNKQTNSIEEKYRGFIYQIYDNNGRLRKINEVEAKSLIKFFNETEQAEEEVLVKTKERLKNADEQTEENKKEKLIKLETTKLNTNTTLEAETNALKETVIQLNNQLTKLEKDKLISQPKVDIIAQKLLTAQLQQIKEEKKKAELELQLGNCEQSNIDFYNNQETQLKNELSEVNHRLNTPTVSNNTQ